MQIANSASTTIRSMTLLTLACFHSGKGYFKLKTIRGTPQLFNNSTFNEKLLTALLVNYSKS